MDEVKFNKEVDRIRRQYARSGISLPQFMANAYEGTTPPVQSVQLDSFIWGAARHKAFWDAVNLIAQRQLKRGNPLPAALADWVKDVLADQYTKRQKDKKRPRPAKGRLDGVRDQKICMAIEILIARGYSPTRRKRLSKACAEGGSACDVAGAAFGLNYKNTERIWLSGAKPPAS